MVFVTMAQFMMAVERPWLNLRFHLLAAAGILTFYGLMALIFGIMEISLALESNEWEDTSGKIVSARLARYPTESAIALTSPIVLYQYRPDNRILRSDIVAFGQGGSFNPDYAREIVRRYPAGQHVLVHYDPERPTLAVLEPGLSPQVFSLPGMGLLFLALAAGLVYCRRYLSPAKPPKRKRSQAASQTQEIKSVYEPVQASAEGKIRPPLKHMAVPLPQDFSLEQGDGRLKITGADRRGLFRATFPNRMPASFNLKLAVG
jgi:hypothetical protein